MTDDEKEIEAAPMWVLKLCTVLLWPLAFIYDLGKFASEAMAEIDRRKGEESHD